MKNILVAGKPRAGKTTLITEVIDNLRDKSIGGFYTQEIRKGGERKGFRIRTLDGKEGILAHKVTKSKYKVGSYGVNIEDLEGIGVVSIEVALKERDIVVIDEIGKMELYSKKFEEAVIRTLNSPKRVLATIPEHRNRFLNEIRRRNDVELVEITPNNRDLVVEDIVQRLCSSH